uniref:hypothetical protein n=1 Tax=Dissulfurimicrobium sp. TaxID=2022436 RepID=UPI00404AFB42
MGSIENHQDNFLNMDVHLYHTLKDLSKYLASFNPLVNKDLIPEDMAAGILEPFQTRCLKDQGLSLTACQE